MNLCLVDKIWISVSKSVKFIWILCFEYFGDVDYNAGFIFSLEAKPAGAQGAKAMFQKMDNAAPKPKYVWGGGGGATPPPFFFLKKNTYKK